MSANYLKDLASVLDSIDYKDHIVEFNADLVYGKLNDYPAYIEFDQLVEEQVKINMIEGYDTFNKDHRKLEYYDMFDMYRNYFKEFIIQNSDHKLFKMINNRVHFRHMYVKQLYKYINESSYRYHESAAELVIVECCELEDRSIYWLFDQAPSRVERFPIDDKLKIKYRNQQVDAFQETIGDALCFDVVDLISQFVLKDVYDQGEAILVDYTSSDSE